MSYDNTEQGKEIKKNYDLFIQKLGNNVRFKGTPLAEIDCELCGNKTKLVAFTAFMYPDYTLKALCNPCGAKERLRLDYSNKN